MSEDKRPGLSDPDDWIGWWLDLHPSDLLPGEIANLALRCLASDSAEDGAGLEVLRFSEGEDEYEVTVSYLVEQFERGRIFHVLSIRSEGDPLPPFADIG